MRMVTRTVSLLCLLIVSLAPAMSAETLTARDIVQRIQSKVTCEWAQETVDTFKAGNPDDPVTGVATTFLASLDVLKKAVDAGCNFIITHEPTFYNHLDEVSDLQDDEVLKIKRDYIAEHHLIVWRFHDHIHRTNPDGIVEGIVEQYGLKTYRKNGEPTVFEIPPVSVKELATQLKNKLSAKAIRVIGDPNLISGKLALSVGASGSLAHIQLLERPDVEILLAGEAREWETVEYVRDAAAAGKRKAMIILGHSISEEAGMKYCTTWLKEFIDEVPITFILTGEAFWAP